MTDLAFRCESLALVGLLAAGCGYPSFEFRSSTKTTTHTATKPDAGGAGGGGSGGGGGSATGNGGSAGAGGAVRPDVRVNCTTKSTLCASGEVCCYHEQNFACDHCGAEGPCDANGACAGNYHVLACSRNADCTAGNVCCGTVADAQGSPVLFGTTCAPSCTLEITYIMCKGNEDCSPGQTCKKLGYAGYGFCSK